MSETHISAQDRNAIYDIMSRYAWCLDRGDLDGLAATFTPDGAIHSTTTGRVFEGTEGIKEFAANALFSGYLALDAVRARPPCPRA